MIAQTARQRTIAQFRRAWPAQRGGHVPHFTAAAATCEPRKSSFPKKHVSAFFPQLFV
jgi:hypothetical protein